MRLATFKVDGRVSYGVVTDDGIVDLGKKLSRYPTLLDVHPLTHVWIDHAWERGEPAPTAVRVSSP